MIEVVRVGLQATIQDLGRPGFGFLGVPKAGAADPQSLRLANRLVGNSEGAAGIEILMGNTSICFASSHAFALTGAPCATSLDRRPMSMNCWAYASAGQTLTLGRPLHGLRTYLAVAGGIDTAPVMGSRSTDTLSGIGPSPLQPGSVLTLGAPRSISAGFAAGDVVVSMTVSAGTSLTVTARLGPRDDLFTGEAISALLTGPWQVSHQTDRVAARLIGPALRTSQGGQLPTEGLALGSIQVPPSGQPIIHLANHPPTGGYPVIAVVDSADAGRIAQAPPGTQLRFTIAPRISFD